MTISVIPCQCFSSNVHLFLIFLLHTSYITKIILYGPKMNVAMTTSKTPEKYPSKLYTTQCTIYRKFMINKYCSSVLMYRLFCMLHNLINRRSPSSHQCHIDHRRKKWKYGLVKIRSNRSHFWPHDFISNSLGLFHM